MEVRINSSNDLFSQARVLKNKIGNQLNLVKMPSSNDITIAKMNFAYNNPTKDMIAHKKDMVKLSNSIDFNKEYSEMEKIYKSGYVGFGENI